MSVFVTKALQQVWCSPEMDYQRIFHPARLTSHGGVLRSLPILFNYVDLPTLTERYHVFQMGNRLPSEMGIETDLHNKWVSLEEVINQEQMQLDVYTDMGVFLPAKDVYLMRLNRSNFIMAIRERGNLFGEREAAIFIRSYTNAWFSSPEAQSLEDRTFIKSVEVRTTADAAALVNLFQDYSRRAGIVRVTKNGIVSELGGVAQIAIGTHIDLFYDGAVKWTVTLPIADLKMFNSELDETEKYIIHPPKSLTGAKQIHYHDDVDFYVVTGNGTTRRGLFLHSNVKESQRMLTHNDYAIRVGHVNSLCAELGTSPENCAVVMYIRKGRRDRELSYERHFIHELYKLPDAEIIDILAEEKASIEYWTARCLENSYYTKLMRSGIKLVTEDDALKAFGYGGCTVEAMQNPIPVRGGATLDRPLGFRTHALVTTYDRTTGLSDMRYVGPASTIDTQGIEEGTIDFRLASTEHRRKVYHQIESFDLANHLSFTAYKAPKLNGVRDGEWENVTLSTDYAYEDGRFKWLIELPLYEVMVVPGDYSDLFTKVIDYPAETLIDLAEFHNVDGSYIPTAEIRVIANNRLLCNEVDYIVRNGKLQICNYDIGKQTAVNVKIARVGCESDRPRIEEGYIFNNTLSRNSRYDLHGSSVKTVVMGKDLLAYNELEFAETGGTSTLLENGLPYEMSYYRGPIYGAAWWKVSDLRDDWDKTFTAIEDYLTARLNEVPDEEIPAITEPYYLFSPMMHNIITDLANGTLNLGEGPFLDAAVKQVCEGYEYLLPYEPLLNPRYDGRLIDVTPHAYEDLQLLTEDEFYFINRVNAIYMNGELMLNQFVGVSNE